MILDILLCTRISAILFFDTHQSTKRAQRKLFTDRKTKNISLFLPVRSNDNVLFLPDQNNRELIHGIRH